jgi:hypothetical protein
MNKELIKSINNYFNSRIKYFNKKFDAKINNGVKFNVDISNQKIYILVESTDKAIYKVSKFIESDMTDIDYIKVIDSLISELLEMVAFNYLNGNYKKK